MWKNQLQLELEYNNPEFHQQFTNALILRNLLKNCIIPENYKAPKIFESAIALIPEVEKWIPFVQKRINDSSIPEIKLAFFIVFFHQKLFVKLNDTDFEAIKNQIDADLVGEKIKFPWVYSLILYNRFFELFPTRTTLLSYEETKKLLESTPQGVFQLGNYTVGSLGLITSLDSRILQPVRSAPMWHCSDASCNSVHTVKISSSNNKLAEIVYFIEQELAKRFGQASEWNSYFYNLIRGTDHYDDMQLGSLPWLIANAFSEAEIRLILRTLLEENSSQIREKLPQNQRFKKLLSGSPEKISETLNLSQAFQLILVSTDETIINCVESLIHSQKIKVPATEIRSPIYSNNFGGWLSTSCECSKFGIRVRTIRQNTSLDKLKRLIRELYTDTNKLDQLGWKLRHINGQSIFEKLDRYIHKEDPKVIAEQLLMESEEFIEKTINSLKFGYFTKPNSKNEEDTFIEKVLWKLGFDISVYPSYLPLFWKRIEDLLKTSRTNYEYTENDREAIRSSAVNFFVSLEEILDYSLSFTTWVLLSDHYWSTQYKCNFDEARKLMADRLNGLQLGSNEPLRLDPNGKNTLYPLIQGFGVLANLSSEISNDSKRYLRPKKEIPSFVGKTELRRFPFLHKLLLLDLRKEDVIQVINLLREVTTVLETANVSNVRNRIEHKRTDFPDQQEIENACIAISGIVKQMELAGLCPSVYIYAGEKIDQYKRKIISLKDYKDAVVEIELLSQFQPLRLPPLTTPQIIVPYMHIGDSFEIIRFRFAETSDYSEIQKTFPKRKTRLNDEEVLEAENIS